MQLPAANISNETAMPIGKRDKKLIDAFPEALLLVEKQGRILSANNAALELLGCHLDLLAGRNLSALITDVPSQLDPIFAHVRARLNFTSGHFR